MKEKEQKLTNLSYESDGRMGEDNLKEEEGLNSKAKDFFNITPDSE